MTADDRPLSEIMPEALAEIEAIGGPGRCHPLLDRIDALSEHEVRRLTAWLAGYAPELVEEQVARLEREPDTLHEALDMSAPDCEGIEEVAALINFRVGAWQDFGYRTPPTPECKPIPPLGERSAEAIKAGHAAVEAIDELTRNLYLLRSGLITELRQDEDERARRVDKMLAESRARRAAL